MEQFVRDARIAQIYEGANGIQALDLVGRKLGKDGGRAIMAFFNEVQTYLKERANSDSMNVYLKPLGQSLAHLQQASMWFMQNAMAKPDNAGAGSYDYMHLFGLVALGYMWCRIAEAVLAKLPKANGSAARLNAKLVTARFFMERMTEPGTGSDLQGVRANAKKSGNGYVLNGSKTFITNGQHANLIIVVAKTDPKAGAKGTSLFVVETDDANGFRRGRKLKKLGMDAADTSELFFEDVQLPASSLLGTEEGQGFYQLMKELPQERLIVAVHAVAMMERALALTIDYVKQRKAFGQAIIEFQNTQFELAECKTDTTIAKVFLDHCIERHVKGELDTVTASMAKYRLTDTQGKVIDRCLQLFGGYGYMDEYPISRMYRDARVLRIYAGTNEIMKLLIARSL